MQPIQLESVAVGDGGGNDRAVLRIGGELDAYTAPRLRERITDLTHEGAVHLIADMRGVGFMDSTGLGVLVGGLKMVRAQEGTLALVIADPRILRIFQVTGLTKHFPIHPTVVAAIMSDAQWHQAVGGVAGDEDQRGVEDWCRKHGLL